MAIDAERLKEVERMFKGDQPGGCYRGARVKHSPHDPLRSHNDRGCDRMSMQDYAKGYAQVLPDNPERIVEMGIFKGTGLAMWSVLYPRACVFGLDVDIDRYLDHRQTLFDQGAFPDNTPLVLTFDELADESWEALEEVIEPGSIDVWVDDAIHRTDVILKAWEKGQHFIRKGGVYIIEDNDSVPSTLAKRYENSPHWKVTTWPHTRLTALTRL